MSLLLFCSFENVKEKDFVQSIKRRWRLLLEELKNAVIRKSSIGEAEGL